MPQLDEQPLPVRVRRYFRAVDALDADTIADFLAEDAGLRLPGIAPIAGRAAIRKAFQHFCSAVGSLRHEPVSLVTNGSVSVFQAEVKISLASGFTVAFPATYHIRWAFGEIREISVDLHMESRSPAALRWSA